jgi:phosphoserine phosphatase RsbU/P
MQQSSPALAALGRSYRELESTSLALLEEKNALTDRLSEAKERVAAAYKKDMALLAAVQSMFLPAQGRISNSRVEIASFYRSADDCGGDWWWWEENDEGFRILVGDVSGHGSGAAMVTGALASVARLAAKNPAQHGATQLLRVMHEELAAIAKGAYHMTMALLDIPKSGGVATIYSAAAPHLLRLAPDGKISVAPLRGTPLGLAQNDPQIGKAEIQIPKGTRLFLFTDGMYEFESGNGVPVGVQMLRRALTATAGMDTDQASKKIVDTITELHPDDVPQADDMTFVIVDIK